MNTSDTQMKELQALIIDKLQHTYLDKHMKKAVIPEEKLFVLLSVMNHAELSALQKNNYIITTMLVQIALDTHDTVVKVTTPDEGKQEKHEKQLAVLAGDYYSGLYYSLLANSNDLDMIHVLASAIKEINEAKMNLYYLATDSFNDYVQIVQKVESLLFVRTAAYVKEQALTSLIEDWLLHNRLVLEKQLLLCEGYSPLFAWWPKDKSELLTALEVKITTLNDRLTTTVAQLPTGYHDIKAHLTCQLKNPPARQTKYAEEG
ncbi:heptaprenyl diphosphate synthase component 1 [Lentibacillus sp. N15]|uniref:heptaprenyl diphosphate synthase component 1 n=1 Tax=Lentibacillus songyuanensis TaxID=3136161 RepID=UPI0031BA2633